MRGDMQDVYSEKPCSSKSSKAYAKKSSKRIIQKASRTTDYEGLPKFETNRLIRGKNSHYGCRNYNVIYKYIASQVGRKWNDIYSDICYNMNVDTHLRGYIQRVVAINVWIDEKGLPHNEERTFYKHSPIYENFYVHPITGILTKTPIFPRKKKKQENTNFYRDVWENFFVKDKLGIWYKCELAKIPTCRYPKYWPLTKPGRPPVIWKYEERNELVYDVYLKSRTYGEYSRKLYGLNNMYCFRKQQLNKQEIKELKKKLARLAPG